MKDWKVKACIHKVENSWSFKLQRLSLTKFFFWLKWFKWEKSCPCVTKFKCKKKWIYCEFTCASDARVESLGAFSHAQTERMDGPSTSDMGAHAIECPQARSKGTMDYECALTCIYTCVFTRRFTHKDAYARAKTVYYADASFYSHGDTSFYSHADASFYSHAIAFFYLHADASLKSHATASFLFVCGRIFLFTCIQVGQRMWFKDKISDWVKLKK